MNPDLLHDLALAAAQRLAQRLYERCGRKPDAYVTEDELIVELAAAFEAGVEAGRKRRPAWPAAPHAWAPSGAR